MTGFIVVLNFKEVNFSRIFINRGYGKLQDGFAGMEQACAEAIKNAVREYWRAQIKNKPKEIESRLLICCAPVIGVEAGRYRVMLDFFMETDRILNYEMF